LEKGPEWLECAKVLELMGGPERRRAANYRTLVEDQVRQGLRECAWEGLRDQVILGGEEFAEAVKAAARGSNDAVGGGGKGRKGKAKGPGEKWLRRTCSLDEVIAAVAEARGERWEEFRDRHGDRGRDLALFLARRATGLTTSQLAEAMGLKQHANVSIAVKRYAAALTTDKEERAFAGRAAELLHVTL
jgi:hypothetical protein